LIFIMLGLLAHAEPELSVEVGEHARVTHMPTINKGVSELAVRDSEGDIYQLRGRRTPGIKNIDVVFRGEGYWLLRARVSQPDTRVEGNIEDGNLTLTIVPGERLERTPPGEVLPLEVLLSGDVPVEFPDPLPTINFLYGEAISFKLKPEDYPLGFATPGWLDGGTRSDLNTARKKLLSAQSCGEPCKAQAADALYELGWRYLDMGWGHEAHHYLSKLSTNPGDINRSQIAMSQAYSGIATGQYEQARNRLTLAYALGAPEDAVVEGLAVVTLATAQPARVAIARKLASLTADPQALMLVGELLQIEGRYEESIPYYAEIFENLEGDDLARASLRMGDAVLLSGDIDRARALWNTAPEELSAFRSIYGELYRLGPAAWVAIAPQLRTLAQLDGEVAAESLYLVSRIDAELGIDIDAIEDLSDLLDAHPRLSVTSDAPALLWQLYSDRVRRLHSDESWYRLAALHESAWRAELIDEVDETDILWSVARAYEALGLPRQAIQALSLGLEVVIAAGENHPDMTLHLAHLYQESGACEDGLKTIRYLKSIRTDIPRSEMGLLTGRMLISCERSDEAVPHLRKARASAETAEEAALLLATIDAKSGRCGAAIAPLKALLMAPDAQWTDPDAGLSLTRCLAEVGRMGEAAAVAEALSQRAGSEEASRYADYLSSLYREDPNLMEPGEDIWGAVTADRAAVSELESVLKKRQ
jgi:tetratricopeptide (TPR) repeat protein